MTKYNDYPILECANALEQLKERHPHMTFFQKWTCAKCGERVTGETPNQLFTSGRHDGDCGHVTDILQTGCNYLIIHSTTAEGVKRLFEQMVGGGT